MFFRLWSATARATLLAESRQSRPISPVLPIITSSSVTMIRSRGRGAGLVAVTVRRRQTSSQPSLSTAFCRRTTATLRLLLKRERIAKRLLRNIAVEQIFIFGNFSPDSQREPGLPAYLQEARATKVFLIKRDDNHGSYLARQFVKSSLRSRPCRFVAVLVAASSARCFARPREVEATASTRPSSLSPAIPRPDIFPGRSRPR